MQNYPSIFLEKFHITNDENLEKRRLVEHYFSKNKILATE